MSAASGAPPLARVEQLKRDRAALQAQYEDKKLEVSRRKMEILAEIEAKSKEINNMAVKLK
jgi:hypothetical protein